MNPNIDRLQPYPFEKLAKLYATVQPPEHKSLISLAMGEPKHPPAEFIVESYRQETAGLSSYPTIKGTPALRQTIAAWLEKRFQLDHQAINPDTQVLPVNGTREALFAIVQAVINTQTDSPVSKANAPVVIMPNPFYQIYEGAALLAGASPYFLNCTAEQGYLPDFESISEKVWNACQVLFICTPGNPTGTVMDIPMMQKLINLAQRYDFIIASDECYSEIYFDETSPPPGLLQAAAAMGNHSFDRCLVFHSLSKRSNLPGLRSGFVAGDAKLIEPFYRYRTYHGCAMSLNVQNTSICAWQDETHVQQNRELYREKFSLFTSIVGERLALTIPAAGFYLWPKLPGSDEIFAKELFKQQHISCLPGRYLAREYNNINPGENHIRLALVSSVEQCQEAAERINLFLDHL